MTISSPETGISLEVDTTSPGLQFYSGNMLSPDDPVIGKGGIAYPQYGGFAMETQVSILPHACNAASAWSALLKECKIFISFIKVFNMPAGRQQTTIVSVKLYFLQYSTSSAHTCIVGCHCFSHSPTLRQRVFVQSLQPIWWMWRVLGCCVKLLPHVGMTGHAQSRAQSHAQSHAQTLSSSLLVPAIAVFCRTSRMPSTHQTSQTVYCDQAEHIPTSAYGASRL